MTDIMEKYRPDAVFFENVQTMDRDGGDGDSNLSILKEKWAALGYECQVVYSDTFVFGLPQHRKRIVIVALNIRDPELLTFSTRDVDTVFRTLQELILLCHRTAECATQYLLPSDHHCVQAELERATAEATRRDD